MSTRTRWILVALLGLCGCSDSAEGNNMNNVLAGAGGAAGVGVQGGVGGAGGGAIGGTGGAAGVAGMTGGASGVGGVGGAGVGGMAGGVGGVGGGTGGAGGDAGGEPAIATTCEGQSLYETDPDTSVPGPWPVGVKTVDVPILGGALKTEVWYPAMYGSDSGATNVEYDQRSWLPGTEASKVPDANNKNFVCDCYRDLPPDMTHGPYPVVIFIHGTGSFRAASMTTMTAWASRGFIVVAADHFGLDVTDQLGCPGSGISQNVPRDLDAIFAGLTQKTGPIGFMGDRADMTRVGVGGHSQGGGIAVDAGMRAGVKIILPFAALSPVIRPSPTYEAAIFVTGMDDSITGYAATTNAYNSVSVHKTLVGITGGQHLDVSDLCSENDMGQKGIEVANQFGVCNTLLLTALAQCGTIAPDVGPKIVNYITTAALEETLQCRDRAAAYSMFETKFPAVGDFQQAN